MVRSPNVSKILDMSHAQVRALLLNIVEQVEEGRSLEMSSNEMFWGIVEALDEVKVFTGPASEHNRPEEEEKPASGKGEAKARFSEGQRVVAQAAEQGLTRHGIYRVVQVSVIKGRFVYTVRPILMRNSDADRCVVNAHKLLVVER